MHQGFDAKENPCTRQEDKGFNQAGDACERVSAFLPTILSAPWLSRQGTRCGGRSIVNAGTSAQLGAVGTSPRNSHHQQYLE